MRVTNSMLVSHFKHNLNSSMNRISTIQNQMTSGKTYANVSEDPVATIYSHQATQRIRRLEFYERNLDTAKSWLTSAESGMMELNEIIKNAYEATVDNAEDIMSAEDKKNAAVYIGQLRDQVVSALNNAFGLKHTFGGYNTTGTNNASGGVSPPFTVVDNKLHYNGEDLTDAANTDVIERLRTDLLTFDVGLRLDIGVTVNGIDAVIFGVEKDNLGNITKYNNIYNLLDDLYNTMSKGQSVGGMLEDVDKLMAGGKLSEDLNKQLDVMQNAFGDLITGYDEATVGNLLGDLAEVRRREGRIGELYDQLRALAIAGPPEKPVAGAAKTIYDWENEKNLWIGGAKSLISSIRGSVNDGLLSHNPSDIEDALDALEAAFDDQMPDPPTTPWTLSGANGLLNDLRGAIDAIDWFAEVEEKYDALNTDLQASPLSLQLNVGPRGYAIGNFIRPLQNAQAHLLGRIAEIGGKTQRIEMLESRYELDNINYHQMLSDAEDADMAEVIMNFKMAESVYKAALSAGASIIQPTLMDFLR